jgi:hypothetical protein
MALILFPDNDLQEGQPQRWTPEANPTPGRSLKSPQKISPKDRELENLLRNAVRLRDTQARARRTKTDGTKTSRKAR